MKAALLLFGVGAAATVALVWFIRRSVGTVNASSGATPLPPDTPDAPPSGKITNVDRNAFTGFTFSTTLTNANAAEKTFNVAIDFVPAGGLQFGVDPFHSSKLITVPARSIVGVDFIDSDLSFAPFAAGKVTLSIDGQLVDQK